MTETPDASNPPAAPEPLSPEASRRQAQGLHLRAQGLRKQLRPLNSLVAAATRLTSRQVTKTAGNSASWQEDAWEMVDLVGEQRFLSNTLAGRMSQARLYVGKLGEPTDAPMPVEDEAVNGVLDAFGVTPSGRSQLLQRLSVNLFVAGDGWLVGIPTQLLDALYDPAAAAGHPAPVPRTAPPTAVEGLAGLDDSVALSDLEWRMLSVSEVSTDNSGKIKLRLGETDTLEVSADEVYLIRVWRPHPRRWWEADSPTRSSLPVLRELVGLTMHISAQVDSRLAGAGMLVVPRSAQEALSRQNEDAGVEDASDDQFTEALIEAMLKPISDRSSASALVPLVVTVPDEAVDRFNYITFAKPLDTEARSLREESIRRLALGQDAPPELLLGSGSMNHWGAWLVQEDVVTTHIEPPLALICDALTTQYLWPVLRAQGVADPESYVIWYDVSDLMVRPNHGSDALRLFELGAIDAAALRAATGFDESDAPPTPTQTQELPVAVALALDMVRQAPSLAQAPGLPALVGQINAVIQGGPVPATTPPADSEPAPEPAPEDGDTPQEPGGQSVPEGPPDTSEDPATLPPPPAIAASAAKGRGRTLPARLAVSASPRSQSLGQSWAARAEAEDLPLFDEAGQPVGVIE